jgi:hypothetical protein
MNEWAELDRALAAMASSGCAEVREDGEWLAELATLHCELRCDNKNPLVRLWSSESNLTRRILRVRERTDDRIVLEVRRFGRLGRAKPGKLEFLRSNRPRGLARVTREQFRSRLHRVLAEQFPDAVVDPLTASPDLEHSLSGVYVRGRMHEGSREWAVMAVAPRESAATIEKILTFGILWLDLVRAHAQSRAVEGLRLFVPEGASRVLLARAGALSAAARVEVFEFRDAGVRIQKMAASDEGNVESWLTPRREVESALGEAREAISRIHALALHLPSAGDDIGLRFIAASREVSICFRGLEFARWSQEGIFFGLGDRRIELTAEKEPALDQLVRQIDLYRSSLATKTNYSLYRAAPERWMETLVIQDPTGLDAQLDPGHLYSQLPTMGAGERGVIDLLGVTRRGRLVVIELKAWEDLQLPMQAVDYWQRVRRHQRDGDFERYGYFAGKQLDAKPPLVWLVAPALRFHSSQETVLKYLSPEIQVTRIGLNENWRRGLKVVFRQ